MQTFLPYADFALSAEVLDMRRLCSQKREAYMLLRALGVDIYIKPENSIKLIENYSSHWRNHPAAKMWRGYENCLLVYLSFMTTEWIKRGYKNNMPIIIPEHFVKPFWLGDERFHSAHRSKLFYKKPDHYRQFDWSEMHEPEKEYVWPV